MTNELVSEYFGDFFPLKTVTATREYSPAAPWLFAALTRNVLPACGTCRRAPAPSWSSRWSGCSQSAATGFWCTTPWPLPTHTSSPRELQQNCLILLWEQPHVQMKVWHSYRNFLPVSAACTAVAGMSLWCVFSPQGSGWRCFGNRASTATRIPSLCLHKPGSTRVRGAEGGS